MYRKKKIKKWNQKSRFGKFVEKLQEEQQLASKRSDLTNVLLQISEKRSGEYWNSVVPILTSMQNELVELGKVPNIQNTIAVINYCVKFFDITSRHQDLLGGTLQCAPLEKEDAMKAFHNDLYYSGRHEKADMRQDSHKGFLPYWNTTQKGESITTENIRFGPELGLPCQPASFWVKLSKKKKFMLQK